MSSLRTTENTIRTFHYSTIHHDDVIKWKYFPRYWSFVRGIHRSPVNSPHKDQWRRALMFSLICAWKKNGLVNNLNAGDLRHHRGHHDLIVMWRNLLYQLIEAEWRIRKRIRSLSGAKPSEPTMAYCQSDQGEQISVKFESKCITFYSRKCIW